MTTKQARFEIGLTTKALGSADNPQISATASSTETDLAGDRFMLSALRQMAGAFPGMTIFLNHQYVVPSDVFGKVASATVTPRGQFHDLDLVIDVATLNPRAMATYQQIKDGVTLGISVGVLVDAAREAPGGGLEIIACTPLEASIVGIPANRRSWVHEALKAASYAVVASTKGKAASGPEVLALVAALRAMSVLVDAEAARAEAAESDLGALWDQVNAVLDTPFGRKIDETIVSSLEALGDRYPHLHPAIVAHLARGAS